MSTDKMDAFARRNSVLHYIIRYDMAPRNTIQTKQELFLETRTFVIITPSPFEQKPLYVVHRKTHKLLA